MSLPFSPRRGPNFVRIKPDSQVIGLVQDLRTKVMAGAVGVDHQARLPGDKAATSETVR